MPIVPQDMTVQQILRQHFLELQRFISGVGAPADACDGNDDSDHTGCLMRPSVYRYNSGAPICELGWLQTGALWVQGQCGCPVGFHSPEKESVGSPR